MSAFNIWRENPPPRETYVWAKFALVKDDWQMVKTCRRGCCVSSFFGSMILPKFWREPTADEVQAEIEARAKIKPMEPLL